VEGLGRLRQASALGWQISSLQVLMAIGVLAIGILAIGTLAIAIQLRKAFRCNSFGLCPKCWPKNFQFSSVNLCHKAIILLKIAQKMDKTL
jgi:hypothetical protein